MDDDFFGEPAPAQAAASVEAEGESDDFFGSGEAGEQAEQAPAGNDDMFGDDFDSPAPAAEDNHNIEEEVGQTEEVVEPDEGSPEGEEEQEEVQMQPEVEPAEAQADPEPEEEVEQEIPPLVKWEMENRELMARRDQEAQEKLDKMQQEAKETIDQFYAERTDLVAGNHERNVGAETEFCKQRDALFSHGDVWERVVSLIDLKGTNEKKQSRVGRMRSLLLHMKNEAK